MNRRMKKITIIIGIVLIIAIVTIVAVVWKNSNKVEEPEQPATTTNLPEVDSSEELIMIVQRIYRGLEIEMPNVETQVIDLSDSDIVKSFTGLDNGNDLEYAVASEPLMSSQPYSLVLAKVKDGADANEIAKQMNININIRKWVCVAADVVLTTSSENYVFLVMSREETAKAVYERFKEVAGEVGLEYVQINPEVELTTY